MLWLIAGLIGIILLANSKVPTSPASTPVSGSVIAPILYNQTSQPAVSGYTYDVTSGKYVADAPVNSPIAPAAVLYPPAPGYAGPGSDGLFYWAGMGNPPNGLFKMAGSPVEYNA